MDGPSGTGKSRIAAEKLHAYCMRYPGSMALAVRKTRSSMTNSTVLFLEREIIGPDPSVRHVRSANRFEYANGSILAYGGMADEAQREQIRSIGQAGGVDIAWLEEANRLSETDYNEILTRMRGHATSWQQVILTTNPGAWVHWINQRLILGRQATRFQARTEENTYNPAAYIDALNTLTGITYKRLRLGLWCQAEGVVYDEFDPDIHLVDAPGPWKRVVAGVDEGYTNPAVILVIGEDGDGRKHCITEHYAVRQLQDDFVTTAVMLMGLYGIETFYADPSAAGLIAAMREADLRVIEAENDVADGISTVKSHLRQAGDGRPRLTFSESCKQTLQEIETYVWAENRAGIKEVPIKANDHAMDALRYALHTQSPVTAGHVIEYAPDPLLAPRELGLDDIPI